MGTVPKTPNLGLSLPPQGTDPWDQPNNSNFIILDTVVAGLQHSWQGAWNASTTYQLNQMVTYNGQTYNCLTAGNLNKEPDLFPALWGQMTMIGPVGLVGPTGPPV